MMARSARIVIPDCPHHVTQRGHDRQAVFKAEADYRYYLDNLVEWKKRLDCKVYAYCFMTNHVHLVVDPGSRVENLGKLMKRLAGRQTRYVNKREDRCGTLWSGRYNSSPIDSDRYLMACCRYVEMNPVRAGLTDSPAHYSWSSYRCRAGMEEIDWIDVDPGYAGLGRDAKERATRYREFMDEKTPEGELKFLRTTIRRGQLIGTKRFVDDISRKIGRTIEQRTPGRPRRIADK